MKLISATIRPRDWGGVRAALARLGVHDISLTKVQVLAADNGRVQPYAGAEYIVDRVPQSQIEVAVDDGLVERVMAAIDQYAVGGGQYIVNCLMGRRISDAEPQRLRACVGGVAP
jgi:nitrogen regulatory protein PII